MKIVYESMLKTLTKLICQADDEGRAIAHIELNNPETQRFLRESSDLNNPQSDKVRMVTGSSATYLGVQILLDMDGVRAYEDGKRGKVTA